MIETIVAEILKVEPLIFIYLILVILSTISKRIFMAQYGMVMVLIVKIIAGKTTNFNVNVVATIGITVSIAANVVQFMQNQKLKKGSEKNEPKPKL